MGDVNKIVIQQNTFAPGVAVEECERIKGKSLIRFARIKDVGVGERISRFIEDLFTGTKKAKGCLCDRQNLPAHVYIGGRRLVVSGNTAHPAGAGQKKLDISFQASGMSGSEQAAHLGKNARPAASAAVLSAPVTDARAVRTRMAEDLTGQFAANGFDRKDSGLRAFLACSGHARTLRPQHAIQLMAFADSFGRIEKELHQDVATEVRSQLQQLQGRIRQDLTPVDKDIWSNFTFRLLNAQDASAAPQRPSPPQNPLPASPPSSSGNVPLAENPNNSTRLISQAPPPPPLIDRRPQLSTRGLQENTVPEPPAQAPNPPQISNNHLAQAGSQNELPDENTVSPGGQGSLLRDLVTGRQKLKPVAREKIEPEVTSNPLETALLAGLARRKNGLQENDELTKAEIDEWEDPPPADLTGRENTT